MVNGLVVRKVAFNGTDLLAVQDRETGKIYAGINSILRDLSFDEKQIRYRRDKRAEDQVIYKGMRKFSGTLLLLLNLENITYKQANSLQKNYHVVYKSAEVA